MEHGIYVIRDDVARLCAPVFQAVNDGVARRSFLKLLAEVPSYDQDAFHLHKVAIFDDVEMAVKALEVPFEIKPNIPSFNEADDVKVFDFKDRR